MASQDGGGQQSLVQSLARQGSIYSLTLNEVQNQLGEPLHSMNLDELLKNVLPAEADLSLAMDPDGASAHHVSGPPGIQRQGSITMTRALSKKTVDEVWRDIQQGHKKSDQERSLGRERRQQTLGEMTLEDFLMKAGVVAEGSLVGNAGPVESADPVAGAQGFMQGVHWLQQYHQIQQQQQSMMGAYVHPEGQMAVSSPLVTMSDPQSPRRKRWALEDTAGKSTERRQKRMIKNRESAARSRARKQAYTNELENKVSRLEEENERLRKQKELDKILRYVPPPEPKYQLRRSSSSPF